MARQMVNALECEQVLLVFALIELSAGLGHTTQCVSSSIPPDPSFRRGFAYDAAAFT
jgi:hypothetical protein